MVFQQAYSIRQFTPKDLKSVIQINRMCLPENYTPNFFLEVFRNCPNSFLVAEIDGEIVGYVMCRIEYGFSDFNRIRMLHKGHLVSIAVLEDHRRKKIGSTLLTEAIKALRKNGARECYLEVRDSNKSGIKLYLKKKFMIVRRVHTYYQDGSDALIMSLKLDDAEI